MKYVVAVSGGVDSVVLLDMLVQKGEHELVVAHFDHGIRPESNDDARFVAGLAGAYDVPVVIGAGELDAAASEELARDKRYAFLRSVAGPINAGIVTAHHQDDIIETIAINLTRGTGWRGLAVMGDETITRPLLGMTKREIYDYALERGLEWVEDRTNQTDDYLRNRIRRRVGRLPDDSRRSLIDLYHRQVELRQYIDRESRRLVSGSRYFLTMVDEAVALELLHEWLRIRGLSLTRPQRRRLLYAIKSAQPGTTFEAGAGVRIDFTRREFIVKHPL